MVKRVLLFFATNIAVLALVSIICSLLGVDTYYYSKPGGALEYKSLLIFCFVWGFAGAFISLAISRWSAKAMMGVKLIEDGSQYDWVKQMVYNQAKSAGISTMPEVGIFQQDSPNAFATGPTKNRSLVAFSSGILRQMDRSQIEAVSAHEVGHIVNGDMVTMTLIQGVINAFVMFISRIVANIVAGMVDEKWSGIVFIVARILGDIVFSILAYPIVCWFSRKREFRADNFAGQVAGRENMISALQALSRNDDVEMPESVAALGISGKSKGGVIKKLFSTHPPIEERVAALRGGS